jgi:phosphatidylinositol glycan class B
MRSARDSLRQQLPGFPLGLFVAAAVVVHLIAAWCNGGFLTADEHYQIIEFAQYKLGRQAPSGLAWEFAETMRPGLQPWMAAGAIRLAAAIGIASPFVIALALRILSTMLALWMSFELCARTCRAIENRALKLLSLWVAFFFWLMPTIRGRFSSENWGTALLAAGLCLTLDAADAWPARRTRGVLLAVGAGLVWSAAFYCRFQLGVAIAGAGLWMLTIRRTQQRLLLTLAVSFLVGCGLNEMLDHWLYGAWAIVPYNYLMVNLVHGKAAGFGTSPWWIAAVYFAVALIPPYSVVLLALFAAVCWYGRRELLVWTVLPLVLLHTAIAHKEPRFFTPALYFIGPLLALSIQTLPPWLNGALLGWRRTWLGRAGVFSLCAVNLVLLGVVISIPANDTYRLNRWLWEASRRNELTLYALDTPPYLGPDPMTDTFYTSHRVIVSPVESAGQLRAAAGQGSIVVYYRGIEPPGLVTSVGPCTPILRTLPVWLGRVSDSTHWLDVHPATLCRLTARPDIQTRFVRD